MPGLPTIGPFELLLVLILALLILGPGKLPEVGSALGKTIREFRHASSDIDTALKPTAPAPARPVAAEPEDRAGQRLPEQLDREESTAPGR
ncbi:MAG TPA: twin-arginine translocase TatA/TatE family subunit [Candidatus Caenarcaniphilales bacterium]|nr:twin-arginine translocase TatA/TatE family subunit [Candidatus Caenarcaniphilales bacterium]